MTVQEWVALGVAVVAAAWLIQRWRRRGLDEEAAKSCGHCPAKGAPLGGKADGKFDGKVGAKVGALKRP